MITLVFFLSFDVSHIIISFLAFEKTILSPVYRLSTSNTYRRNILFIIEYRSLSTRLLVIFLIFFRPHEYFYARIIVLILRILFRNLLNIFPLVISLFIIVKISRVSTITRFFSFLLFKIWLLLYYV